MNADEIVKALHWLGDVLDRQPTDYPTGGDTCYAAADLIESLQAQIAAKDAERDAAVEDINHLVFECADDPLELCGEVCANNNGICQRGVAAGYVDKCSGFEWRGCKPERSEDNA